MFTLFQFDPPGTAAEELKALFAQAGKEQDDDANKAIQVEKET
jgi:hypothetical protein